MEAITLLCLSLHLLNDLHDARIERMILFETGEPAGCIFRRQLLQDLGELDALIVARHVLETQGHFDGAQEGVDLLAAFSELGGRTDETFLAGELAQRCTANTVDHILEVWIRDAADDGVDIVPLLFRGDAMLGNDQSSGLIQHAANAFADFLVAQSLVDSLLAGVVTVVRSSSVSRVDGKELPLDVRLQVVDPVDGWDIRVAVVAEGSLFDNPFVELLDLDVEAGIRRLIRDDAVNGRVGEPRTIIQCLDAVRVCVVLDEAMQRVGCPNGVLTGNDSHRLGLLTSINALGNHRGNELENVGSDGASDDVRSCYLLDHVALVLLGVDGAVVVDGLGGLTDLADLGDLIRRGVLESIDDVVHDIDEDDLEAGLVEELGHEATADVAASKVNSFLSHGGG